MDTGALAWTEIIDDVSQDRALAARRHCPYCGSGLSADDATCPGCGESVDRSGEHAPTHERYLYEALARWEEGDLPAASESLGLCLRLHPAYVPALRLAARVAARRGEWTLAREQVGRASRVAPHDPATQALAAAIAAAADTDVPPVSVEGLPIPRPAQTLRLEESRARMPRTHMKRTDQTPDRPAPEGGARRGAMALAGGVAGAGLVELLRRLFRRRT